MKTIELTQGKVALVDDADFEKVTRFKWYAHKLGRCFYVHRNAREGGNRIITSLHRFLTDCPSDMEVNHINGDGLDNRRENLQLCTHQQNTFARCRKKAGASSKHRGVHWFAQSKRWKAEICHNGKDIYLGCFDSEKDAACAYDAKAIELFGEHAALNFP